MKYIKSETKNIFFTIKKTEEKKIVDTTQFGFDLIYEFKAY